MSSPHPRFSLSLSLSLYLFLSLYLSLSLSLTHIHTQTHYIKKISIKKNNNKCKNNLQTQSKLKQTRFSSFKGFPNFQFLLLRKLLYGLETFISLSMNHCTRSSRIDLAESSILKICMLCTIYTRL